MKKIPLLQALLSITVSILLVVLVLIGCEKEKADFPVGIQRIEIEREFTVCYEETSDIATDTAYLIIDLSDATRYPHKDTNAIQLVGWRFQASVSGEHEWHAHLGTVTENDATDGTAEFIALQILKNLTGTLETQTYWEARPLDLWIEDDSLLYASTNISETATTWQNDVAISATLDITDFMAAGDLVLYMVEIADGSTVDFSLCVEYDTR